LGDLNSDSTVTVNANSNSATGNAVIAVYSGANQTGDILWSWHIWVTNYDPDVPSAGDTCIVHNLAGVNYVFMDRNLGATTATVSISTTMGLLYQWGRKDPFTGSSSFRSATEPTLYNESGTGSTTFFRYGLQTKILAPKILLIVF